MIIIHLLWFIDTVEQLFKDFITATTFPQLPAPLKIDKFVLILRKKKKILTLSCFQTKIRNNKDKLHNCVHTGACKCADKKPCDMKEVS